MCGDDTGRVPRSLPLAPRSRGDVSVRSGELGIQGRRQGVRAFAARRTTLRVSLKCDPALAEQLREAHAAVIPGYHLNKRHWNTVILDGSLTEGMVGEMIEDSYDLVVSNLPGPGDARLGGRRAKAEGGSPPPQPRRDAAVRRRRRAREPPVEASGRSAGVAPVDAQGVTQAIDYLAAAAGLSSSERRALIRPHAVNPAVLHARVFGRAPLARETVIASFVEGARVRADALGALADAIGGEPLGREVRLLLVADPPPVRADAKDVVPALRAT